MSANLTDADCRAVALLLGDAERPPWLRRRFAALDQLTREGRLSVLRSTANMEPEAAWGRVLAEAAGQHHEPASLPTLRGAPLSPDTAAVRLSVLHAVRPGDTALNVARRLGLGSKLVNRALAFLLRWEAVERRPNGWHPVHHGRPW